MFNKLPKFQSYQELEANSKLSSQVTHKKQAQLPKPSLKLTSQKTQGLLESEVDSKDKYKMLAKREELRLDSEFDKIELEMLNGETFDSFVEANNDYLTLVKNFNRYLSGEKDTEASKVWLKK